VTRALGDLSLKKEVIDNSEKLIIRESLTLHTIEE
jgi:hypothetical protein